MQGGQLVLLLLASLLLPGNGTKETLNRLWTGAYVLLISSIFQFLAAFFAANVEAILPQTATVDHLQSTALFWHFFLLIPCSLNVLFCVSAVIFLHKFTSQQSLTANAETYCV